MARKKNQRRGRTSQQNINRSGRKIYEQGGQITVLTENSCDVKSQNREGVTYRVSYGCGKFTCECPHHTAGKGCRYKHVAAVEYMLLREAESPRSGDVVIGEAELACAECGSKEYVKNGHDKCKSGRKQRCRCKECRRRFRDNLGFERRHTAPAFITLALMLNGMGMPPLRVRIVPGHMNADVHVDTIYRWLEHYVGMVEEYANPIRPPNLGSELGADEKRQDIRGEESYFVMAMDLATRFIPAWETTADKIGYDATRLLEAAKAKAGRPCPILKTDGLSGHHATFKRVFGSPKGFFIHVCDIHTRNAFPNTNRQERVNGTFAGHTEPARGISSENSLACRIFILDCNYIRPHGGMGVRTPAEAAGIDVRGADRWMAPIPERRGRHMTRTKHPIATPYYSVMPYFAPAPCHLGGTLPKNRSKTPSRSPRIPSLGLAAVRIWAIWSDHPSLQEEPAGWRLPGKGGARARWRPVV